MQEWRDKMGLNRLSEKCKACPFLEKCDNKRMEALGYMKTLTVSAGVSAAQSVLRETTQIMVDGHLQTVYVDEIKKQIEQSLFPERFLRNGA